MARLTNSVLPRVAQLDGASLTPIASAAVAVAAEAQSPPFSPLSPLPQSPMAQAMSPLSLKARTQWETVPEASRASASSHAARANSLGWQCFLAQQSSLPTDDSLAVDEAGSPVSSVGLPTRPWDPLTAPGL